ncbi:MAG: hypothetical protein KI790_19640 [Cyclobacteriaceae bacterium]|nr:hypothetical protein [Cyclobacteriaceae bacterium HetDA_MAG_MS6]
MKQVSLKVTVEYICPKMVDLKTFTEDFHTDPRRVYDHISKGLSQSVINFTPDHGKVLKVEVV